jgi:UPF0755 protein
MKNFSFIFITFLVVLFLLLFSCWQIYLPLDQTLTKRIVFPIQKGEGLREISLALKQQGLIRSSLLFQVYVLVKGKENKLQAGRYELSASMNIPEIAAKIINGENIKKMITIVEGWSIKDIEKELGINIRKFKIAEYKNRFAFLKDAPAQAGLEGFLFPDTYEISPEADGREIVEKGLKNFDRKLSPELRKEIQKQKKTIFEIITMASILEKEVKTQREKEIAAGILWKRLKYKMPLQVDCYPDSYKTLGLPPGPIANPGLESIIAAIRPKQTRNWYYLSTPNGRTFFSETLKEHNIKKARYLR